jgi:16S rRNA (adenine1518-N6/adenine1519-N6)-dimethyltransferase
LDPARSRFGSPGSGLSRSALRALAAEHGVTPRKSLGQHFLADANVARAIARDAEAGPGTRFLEIGAGLGSLTVALAGTGAEVLALETDPRLVVSLDALVGGLPSVRVVRADATRANWPALLGDGSWRMASNLPYHVAVPVLLDLLEHAPDVDPFVVTVQREVFGGISLKVAYRARVKVLRRLGPSVFWPEPKVASVVLRLDRRPPPVSVPAPVLFGLVDEGFSQRRKTMASALVRLGRSRTDARAVLSRAGLKSDVRAEALGLEDFARLADAMDG